jgi:hypothetical protein
MTVEQFISWLDMILQHYQTELTVSSKIRASLEALQLELRCRVNPLDENFSVLGALVADVWLKAIWERVWYYKFGIYLDYPIQPLPRGSDVDIVELLPEIRKQGETLKSLNRCRLAHEAIYLSCVSMAEDKHLVPCFFSPPSEADRVLIFKFPWEEPTKEDWTNWEKFWCGYCNSGLHLPYPLGKWRTAGHRIWQWLYGPDHDKVYEQTFKKMHVCELWVAYCTRSGNMYWLLGEVKVLPINAIPITTKLVIPGW